MSPTNQGGFFWHSLIELLASDRVQRKIGKWHLPRYTRKDDDWFLGIRSGIGIHNEHSLVSSQRLDEVGFLLGLRIQSVHRVVTLVPLFQNLPSIDSPIVRLFRHWPRDPAASCHLDVAALSSLLQGCLDERVAACFAYLKTLYLSKAGHGAYVNNQIYTPLIIKHATFLSSFSNYIQLMRVLFMVLLPCITNHMRCVMYTRNLLGHRVSLHKRCCISIV